MERKKNIQTVLKTLFAVALCLFAAIPLWGQAGGSGDSSEAEITPPEKTIVIRETPANLKKIEQLIKTLDVAPKQVFIEAHIFDITLDEQNSTGIDWSALMTQLGRDAPLWQYDQSTLGETGGNGTFRFGSLSSDHFSLLMKSLKKNNKARSLSNPKVTALNGREATIEIAQKIPYITTTTVDTSGGQQRTERVVNFENIPINLVVTPIIYDNQTIRLNVTPKVTSLKSFVEGIPWTEERTTTTDVFVKNGETIVLGGLITESRSEDKNTVPFFDKIPLIRKLFSKKERNTKRSELVVFITPTIISSGRMPAGFKSEANGGVL
jgi:type II secretory pathway component GspD/PulD (secretin)